MREVRFLFAEAYMQVCGPAAVVAEDEERGGCLGCVRGDGRERASIYACLKE